MNSINAQELKNLISDKNNDFQVIDVRSKQEWDEGHINDPRVINLEVNSLLFNTSLVANNKDVYVICESGGRSSYAQLILKTKGFNVSDVSDGMAAYRKLN